ncbi:MAG: flagellar biosynthetic protein FliO [Pyrinomonadaceae bacterium]
METGLSFLWMMIQTVLALAVVLGLAYFLFRIVLPRFNIGGYGAGMIRIVDRTAIDARKSLVIVEVAGKYLLVAVSENGVNLLSELDQAETEAAESLAAAAAENDKGLMASGFGDRIAELLSGRKVKK